MRYHDRVVRERARAKLRSRAARLLAEGDVAGCVRLAPCDCIDPYSSGACKAADIWDGCRYRDPESREAYARVIGTEWPDEYDDEQNAYEACAAGAPQVHIGCT